MSLIENTGEIGMHSLVEISDRMSLMRPTTIFIFILGNMASYCLKLLRADDSHSNTFYTY